MNNEIDVGQFSEALNNKTDRDLRNVDTTSGADSVIAYQFPSAANNYTWYRLYKSGWVEQGGIASATGSNALTVNLLINMSDTHYAAQLTPHRNLSGSYGTYVLAKTTASIQVRITVGDSSTTDICWQVSGMAA